MSEVLCVVGEHGDDPVEALTGYLCGQHFSRLRTSLLELVAVAAWLGVNLAAGGSGITEKVSGSGEDPIPLRTDVLDLIGPVAPNPTAALTRNDDDTLTWEALDQAGEPSIFDELRSWCALVKEESGFPWSGDDRKTVTGAVAYLAGHLSWLAAQPWVDEFAEAVRRLHRDAHRVAPWREELVRVNDPCSSCGVRAVIAHIGEGWRRCEAKAGGCGKRERLSEYELRVLLPESRRAG